MAATVEVRLTGGLAAMAALVRLQKQFQEGNIKGGGALLLWSALVLKFLGGGIIG
jgi:hypothetical protein